MVHSPCQIWASSGLPARGWLAGLVNLGFQLDCAVAVRWSLLAGRPGRRTKSEPCPAGQNGPPDAIWPGPSVRRIRSVADFQRAVPVRTYEALWDAYLRDAYPVFDNLTWPGRIPFLALTSGTTEGATKYIPVSAEMAASNRKAARTALAFHLREHPGSRLFHGRLFFLGGSTNLNGPPRHSRGRPERHCRRRAVALLPAVHLSST